jgi:Plasmid pRiA4b ORF-3-like protein
VGAKTFKYLYDFGDAWYHTIKVEKFFDEQPHVELPLLLECAGHCPPEDVGGPIGYANFLTAYYDPGHPDHADVRQWHPQPINPTDPRMPELDAALEKLQKAWAKKPPAKRASRIVKG